MPGKEKCPNCKSHYLVYDSVKREAHCQRSVCDFVERVKDKIDYKAKFG